VPLLSLSLHSSSPTFKLLSIASYGGELILDSSSPYGATSVSFYPQYRCFPEWSKMNYVKGFDCIDRSANENLHGVVSPYSA